MYPQSILLAKIYFFFFHLKITIFTAFENRSILHRYVKSLVLAEQDGDNKENAHEYLKIDQFLGSLVSYFYTVEFSRFEATRPARC